MLARCTVLLTIALALAGCGKLEVPRELRLEVPSVITSKDPVVVQVKAFRQDGTTYRPGAELPFRVTPDGLARVDPRGVLSCQRTGEGSVSLAIGEVVAKAKLDCRLAARLETPAKLTLDIATGEVDPQLTLLDDTGKPLNLPIALTSDRGSIVQPRGGRLLPINVGVAKVTARAGQLSRAIDVEVVRTLRPEVLPVDDNRRISYSLDAGKYRLSLELPSPHPVKVDWLGAPYCQYRGNQAKHVVDCTLQSKGSVSFDNPAFLLRGEKTPSVDGVTLREIP